MKRALHVFLKLSHVIDLDGDSTPEETCLVLVSSMSGAEIVLLSVATLGICSLFCTGTEEEDASLHWILGLIT